MKTEILSLVLLLSCTTASAAAVLPNSSGDLQIGRASCRERV